MSPSTDVTPNDNNKPIPRRRHLIGLTLLIMTLAIAYGVWWFMFARHIETTDDAYVAGNVIQVTSQIAGTVVDIHVDDTDQVNIGQALITLDSFDAQNAVDQAEAQLAHAVRDVRVLFVNNDTLKAMIAAQSVELTRAQADLVRRQQLIHTGAVSKEELAHADIAVKAAQATLHTTRAQLTANEAHTVGTTIETHPKVTEAKASVRAAHWALLRTRLPAPIGGQIAKRSVQVGQRITPGMPLLSVVPLDAVWVDANFKEVQIAPIRAGQSVTMVADVYGGKVKYTGRVVGRSAGSGSAFALLPAQNANGNWIKVVQRVPVRIVFDPDSVHAHPLPIGTSMTVKVNTDPAASATTPSTTTPTSTTVFDFSGEPLVRVEARIAEIIASNRLSP